MKKLLAIFTCSRVRVLAGGLRSCSGCPGSGGTAGLHRRPDALTQQLAAPVEAAMAQYPNEAKYTSQQW